MTAPTKQEPGTAVAPPARRSLLSPEQQQRIEDRRAHSAMVQQIKGSTWGKDFDEYTVRAVAAWAKENDVEPVTELDVLGGNVYVKGRYYERILSRLIGEGLVEYARPDWVHRDQRLDVFAAKGDEDAKAELVRRTRERIKHNIPDEADAACVYRIRHARMAEEITGAKWHVPGKKRTIKKKDGGSFQVDADPVGDQSPAETIETRALRRAMLKLKEAFPGVRMVTSRDDTAIAISDVLKQAKEVRAKELEEHYRLLPGDRGGEPHRVAAPDRAYAESMPTTMPKGHVADVDVLSSDDLDEAEIRRVEQQWVDEESK